MPGRLRRRRLQFLQVGADRFVFRGFLPGAARFPACAETKANLVATVSTSMIDLSAAAAKILPCGKEAQKSRIMLLFVGFLPKANGIAPASNNQLAGFPTESGRP